MCGFRSLNRNIPPPKKNHTPPNGRETERNFNPAERPFPLPSRGSAACTNYQNIPLIFAGGFGSLCHGRRRGLASESMSCFDPPPPLPARMQIQPLPCSLASPPPFWKHRV